MLEWCHSVISWIGVDGWVLPSKRPDYNVLKIIIFALCLMANSSARESFTAFYLSASKLASWVCPASHKFRSWPFYFLQKKLWMCEGWWQLTVWSDSFHRWEVRLRRALTRALLHPWWQQCPFAPSLQGSFIFLPRFKSLRNRRPTHHLSSHSGRCAHSISQSCGFSPACGVIPHRHRSVWWAPCSSSMYMGHCFQDSTESDGDLIYAQIS